MEILAHVAEDTALVAVLKDVRHVVPAGVGVGDAGRSKFSLSGPCRLWA